ncbi:MAG: redoxin domain-containing protein [Gemmatimonadaceae bacterium]|nr:redoxin domain-containing protein [Gemmatimonadaceae bacterium]
MRRLLAVAVGIGVMGTVASSALAQLTPTKPTPLPIASGPQVGMAAPDFSLRGATRYGRLKNPVRLSDYRGSTVVLAFFYQARTKG